MSRAVAKHTAKPRKVTTTRAVLYLRVSREGQTTANQRRELQRLAEARGLTLVGEYRETASSAGTRERFEAMMKDAAGSGFDVVMVWALDRFGRSMTGNLQAVLELDRHGVRIVSAREPWLDTSGQGGGPLRSLLVAVFSWVAEQERVRIVERTHAGLERARARGKRLGRPAAVSASERRHARALLEEGISIRQVARQLSIAPSTLHRTLRAE